MSSSQIRVGADISSLFSAAFKHSRNPMVLVDDHRRHVDANGPYVQLLGYGRRDLLGQPLYRFVIDGPLLTPAEWEAGLGEGGFAGEARLRRADGDAVGVQFAATSERVTGRYLVLVVALSTSRWGARFRRAASPRSEPTRLSGRELEIVRLVALGGTGPEIADELSIAHDTVRTHLRNAMEKVDARSRAHLVAKALGEGLILTDGLTSARTGSGAVAT